MTIAGSALTSRTPSVGAVDFSTVVLRDGTHALTANWGVGGFRLMNVADPTANQDAATKIYVDTAVGAITPLPAGTNGGTLVYASGAWVSTAAGTAGQILTSNGAAAPTWQNAPSGLPSGTNGGALVYASGSWASTAAGTAGQILTSNGAAAPTWQDAPAGGIPDMAHALGDIITGAGAFTWQVLPAGGDGTVLTMSGGEPAWTDVFMAKTIYVIDNVTNNVSTALTLQHRLASTAGADNIATRIVFENQTTSGVYVPSAHIDGALTSTSSGNGSITFRVRSSGTMADAITVLPGGIRFAYAARTMVVRNFGNTADLSVWSLNGSSYMTFGSTDATNVSGMILYTPANGEFYLYRGATAHLTVSSGIFTAGNVAFRTNINGSMIVLDASITVHDAGTNSTQVAVRFAHTLSSGTAAANIGVRAAWAVANSAGTSVDTASLDAVLTTATSGAEVGVLDVSVRASGALSKVVRFTSTSMRLEWAARAITLLTSGGSTTVDVFRVDGSSYWCYGSTDATNCGGMILYIPSSADFYLYRGATSFIQIANSGQLYLGVSTAATILRGSSLTIGLTSVVAQYQGGARVPERTVSSNTTLDAQDEVVYVDTTSGNITLTLPAGAAGRVLAIQRIAGANNIIVQRAGSDTIRAGGSGALTSWTIVDGARHGLIYRSGGTEWVAEA